MKNRIKNYVDQLFIEISENKQLRELKEEISANLLEKINDYISMGNKEEASFEKAVSSLGDMSELVENLKTVSNEKDDHNNINSMDKIHVFGYIIAIGILLFGLFTSAMLYFLEDRIFISIATLMPFAVPSISALVYLGLTQENEYIYGMKKVRAMFYSLATAILLFGIFTAGITYTDSKELFIIFATIMPFAIVSISIFIYLGLTEKSRVKMNENWQNKWVNYYKDEQSMQLRGLISGALWIFSIAIFVLLCILWEWYYAWIVFIFTVGFEIVIETIFSSKLKK